MMIVNRIGEVARQKGLNIDELAKKAGVAYGTAHGLYTGKTTRVDFVVLDKICGALEVQPGDVLTRAENETK